MRLKSIKRLAGSALALLVLLRPCASPAQDGPDPLNTLRRSNAGIVRFSLDNGMTGLVKEDHSAPVVAVQIWVGTGSIHEDEFLGSGLSHAIEHMIFKGTTNRAVGVITREINDAGGTINAYTSHDRTVFHTTMPAARWEVGLEVLADAVMNASFPEEEWAREKEVILREMAMNRDNPERVLGELLWRTAYTAHPYRHPVIGYEDVFSQRGREELVSFFKRHYVSDNMIVVVAGAVDAGQVEQRVREIFAGFKRQARRPVVLPREPEQVSPRVNRATGPYNVSRLEWVYPSVPLQHPDTAALDVLAAIVGQGRSSRLVQKLKEEQKLVYEISAWSWTPRDPGLFGISATFDPAREKEVVAAIENEIAAWRTGKFTKEEVRKARRMTLVHELGDLQTMDGQAASIASGEYYAGDPRFSERYLELIENATPETVSDAVRRYLDPHRRSLAILAPETAAGTTDEGRADPAPAQAIKRLVMSNATPLLVIEDHRLPFVYVCAAFRGGLLSEGLDNNGITRLMADMLTRGSLVWSAEQIAETIESLGASLSGFSGENSFGMQARCLAQDVDKVLQVMGECLLRPVFPEGELAKQKDVQLAQIGQEKEKPFALAVETLRQTLFPGHPYQWSVLGREDSVAELTRGDVMACFKRHAVRGNMALSIFGDITPEAARELAERHLSGLPSGPSPDLKPPQPMPELPARVQRREPKEQAILLAGFPGVDVRDSRVDALNVLEESFSGLSSDLGLEVRDKRGLVYYVGAFQRIGLSPGMFVFYAGTREDAIAEVEELIAGEIARVTADGPREDELARVKEELAGRHQMSLQDLAGLAQLCALNELYGLGFDYVFTFEDRIRALTAEDVRNAARAVLNRDRIAVSVLLPEAVPAKQEEQP